MIQFVGRDAYKQFWNFSKDEKENLATQLAIELPALRGKVGASQEEIASAVGISRQTYSAYENRTRPIPWSLYLNSVYTRSGQNSTPNSNATNLHSSQKRCCSFCISSSNASPTFQVQKSIFHQMTKPIQVTVILPLLLAISFSRNDDIHSSISGISNDLIGVIPTIGQ